MKLWNYVFIMMGVIILLHYAGVETSLDPIFNLFGVGFNTDNTLQNVTLSSSAVYNGLFDTRAGLTGLLAALVVATSALIIGTFAKFSGENLAMLPFITGTLVLFITTIQGVLTQTIAMGNTVVTGIVSLLLIPLGVGLFIALLEFFRGTD